MTRPHPRDRSRAAWPAAPAPFRRRRVRRHAALAALATAATLATGLAMTAAAEPGGGAEGGPGGGAGALDLSWFTVDGGGGTSAAGDLVLLATIGQPDAGPAAAGGDWSLTGGFLAGGAGAGAPPCPSDVDGSGEVGFGDLLAVLSVFGACAGCPEDLDGNGAVDFGDVLSVLADFGPCPS